MRRNVSLFTGLAAIAVLTARLIYHSDPLPGFPRLMLWAWESPQDLRFVKPGSAGIAFLARTIWLDEDRARSRPRLQPLRYSPGTDLMAVVRFESAGHGLPREGDVVREVIPALDSPEVRALQIDFDARQSERSWYDAFLRELRRAVPSHIPLSITALESWCEEAGWLSRLSVADATPMLFRMGPGDRPSPAGFSSVACRSSIGVSTDEMPARVPSTLRIFFFHPGPWTEEAYEVAVSQARRWRR